MPQGVINEIEKIIRRFLWGGADMRRKICLVDWKTITAPKLHGGLGIVDLKIRNRGLLSKWIWRYGNEPLSVWRRVVDAKTGANSQDLFPLNNSRGKCSFIWQNINQSNSCILGFTCLLGNGNRIAFWQHNWANGCILKDSFPRIFALSINKSGPISDFGYWIGNKWLWDVKLRRSVFTWEEEQWNAFQLTINSFYPRPEENDRLVWSFTPSGNFTVSSYYKFARNLPQSGALVWKKVWTGLVPPKVEAFVWLLLRKRVVVKNLLLQRGLIDVSRASCAFCNADIETVEHLFFNCFRVWQVWMLLLDQWGVVGTFPIEPSDFIQSWNGLVVGEAHEIWVMLFFAATWSIWLFRNQVVFEGKSWDLLQLFQLIKLRVLHWAKAKKPNLDISINLPLHCTDVRICNKKVTAVRPHVDWLCPSSGHIKFNVDGSSIGKPGPAGVGGILRDDKGETKAIFSKSIGVVDSNYAEFLAIREAFIMFSSSDWASSHTLIVESDSKNALTWLNHPDRVPWRLKNFSNHIRLLQQDMVAWTSNLVPREANDAADSLAKQGVNRADDLLQWF